MFSLTFARHGIKVRRLFPLLVDLTSMQDLSRLSVEALEGVTVFALIPVGDSQFLGLDSRGDDLSICVQKKTCLKFFLHDDFMV